MLTDLRQLDAGERILLISKSYSSAVALINPVHVSLTTKTTYEIRGIIQKSNGGLRLSAEEDKSD